LTVTDANGTFVKPAAVAVADANAAGVPVVISFVLPDANSQVAYTVPTGRKFLMLDAFGYKGAKRGGDSNMVVTVLNGTTPLTDNITTFVAANTRFAAATIVNDGNEAIAAAGTLVVRTSGGADPNNGCRVTVLGKWITP
jgi:hypothetical protein